MAVLSRADWGARPLDHRATKMRSAATRLIIHHSDGGSDPFVAGLKGVERQHMDVKGWSGPAYNTAAGVRAGEMAELRGWDVKTIATLGANDGSWTICAIGDFEDHDTPGPLLENIAVLGAEAIRRGHLAKGFAISGHKDHGATACPGKHLYPHLGVLRDRILELSGAPLPPPVSADERPELRRGDRGPQVGVLQRALRELSGATIVGPEIFGPATERAVRNWQRFFRLAESAMADRATWRSLYFVADQRGRTIR
jgi:Putative peptidoglycan binding domain/N-acetylmuramoyl-L-alanine amidase